MHTAIIARTVAGLGLDHHSRAMISCVAVCGFRFCCLTEFPPWTEQNSRSIASHPPCRVITVTLRNSSFILKPHG